LALRDVDVITTLAVIVARAGRNEEAEGPHSSVRISPLARFEKRLHVERAIDGRVPEIGVTTAGRRRVAARRMFEPTRKL
jgi:hypothetical protein